MTAWFGALPFLALALVVLFAPGALLLVAAGAPWRRSLLFAPAASVGAVGFIGIAADIVGVPFGLPTVAGATVLGAAVLAVITVLIRRWRRARGVLPTPPRRHSARDYAVPGAAAVAALVLGVRIARALGGPDRISQTFDAVFHLNTTRYIVQTGQGSSLKLLGWGTGTGGFYPAAWHDLAALVAVNGNVIAATQALALVVAAVVWPVSVLALVERVIGRRWSVLFGTAALLTGLGVFPARMLDYGVLYPFLLGIALMPMLVAMAHVATSAPDERGGFRGLPLLLAGGLGMVGLALAHAGVLLAFLLIALPLVVRRAYAVGRTRWSAGRRISTLVVAVGAVVVVAGGFTVLNGSATIAAMRQTDWPRIGTPSQAVGAWLLVTPHQFDIPLVVAALTVLGIGVAISTRGLRWLVVAHVLLAVPYVFAAGVDSHLSQLITGFWYNDSVRLGALVPVTAVPLAAIGLTWLVDRAIRLAPLVTARLSWLRDPRRLAVVAVAAGTVVLGVLSTDASSHEMYANLGNRYKMTATAQDGTLLSTNELHLLERLPSLVPAGSRVAANPWNGAGLAYAVSGVPVLVPQLGARPAGEAKVVADGLADAGDDPSVCRALDDLNIHYALDFGPTLWTDWRAESYPGLEGLLRSPAVHLVAHDGRARLYEITACRTTQ